MKRSNEILSGLSRLQKKARACACSLSVGAREQKLYQPTDLSSLLGHHFKKRHAFSPVPISPALFHKAAAVSTL
jgi:hypothetical protein